MDQTPQNYNKALSTLHIAFGREKDWEIIPLEGGLSGASLFLADNGVKKYVARFFDHLSNEHTERLIFNQKVASIGGYGPHVYFDDPEQRIILMDYLSAQPINQATIHKDLALLLQKIHKGPKLHHAGHIWERTTEVLQTLKDIPQSLIDIGNIQVDLNQLIEKAKAGLESAPCHRDLNPMNLIYTDQKFFAVDYDSAGQDDPYIDLAEVAIFYCRCEEQETTLLTLYLGHRPSQLEMDKFRLMKKIAFFFYAVEFFRQVPSETWQITPDVDPFEVYMKKLAEGAVSLENPKEKLNMGLILLQEGMKV